MARKPFKIVNNLDLSGNSLIDVREIYRSDYDAASPYLDILIRAGNDKLSGSSYVGGDLLLYSGYGTTPGAIKLFIPNAAQSANDRAADVSSEFGLKILGTTQTTLKTNSQQVTITTTNADINLQTGNTKSVVINSTNNTSDTDKALEIAGGLYVGASIHTAGSAFTSSATTYSILDTQTITEINLGGVVATLNLGYDGNAKASVTNINTGTNGAYTKAVNIGTGGTAGTTVITAGSNVGGTVNLRGAAINVGVSDNSLATTVTIGSAITENTVKVAGTAAGTINYTTDVSTGIVNLFTSISTGTVNLATAGASTTNIGGAAAKLYIGTSSGYIDTGSATSTAYVFNANATTVNAFGAGTAITIGADGSGTTTVRNSTITFSKATAFNIDGVSPTIATTSTGTLTLFNTNLATVNAFGSAGTITIGNTITGSAYNVGTGATISGATKTVNIGTAGVSGSITNVNIGSTVSGATGSTTIGSTLVTIGNSGASTTATIATASGVTTAAIANTIATTVNFAGAATTLNIGNDTATTQTINIGQGNIGSTAQEINIGGPSNSGVVNFNSTKDASNSTDGGVAIDGGLSVAKRVYIGTNLNVDGSSTLGTDANDASTIRGTVTLTDSSASDPLTLGADVNLYRSAANVLTIDDSVTMTGLEFKGPATWNIGSTTDTLTIGKTSAQLTIKSDLTLEGTIKYLKFNTNPGDLSSLYTAGLMYYSNTDESLEYRPTANGVSISLGQETVLRAKNASATVAIPDGTPVYVSGGSGAVPLISPAKADASETAKVIGITTQTIAADGYGFVTTNGIVRAIDLTALGILTPTSGSMLYLSETTAGRYTLSPPAGTNYAVRLGWILDSATPTACNIFTLIGQSWTHTSTYNALRAVDVIFHDSLLIPVKATPAQSVEGQLVWNSTTHFLTAYNGSAIKTYVDTNSTQDLSNKTYNGLTVTENVVGFQIAGGTGTEKTFLLGMDLTVQTGKVVLTGNSGGSSQLTLPNANFTLNTAGGAGYAAYYSATGTLSGEQYLDVTRGGTGLGSFTDTAIITGGGTGDLKVPGATLTATALGAGSLTTVDIATSTTASTINIGSGAPTTGTKTVNIGTSSGAGSTTNVTIGSSLGTPNTYIYGNVTIGDAAAKVITLTGTVSSAGIKIFDSDSTTYTYTFAPGNIGANTTVTLPTTTGRYLTVGLRTDGLIDLKSVMAGIGSTALVPSAGGIVWTDANGFQILAGTSTAGKVLISGSSVTPAWSTGVLSLGTNFTTNTGTVTIVGNAANTSQLTLPAGDLTLPSSIVAGDIIYGNGSGTLTRLAAQTANYVLVSGASAPAWSTSPTITSMTLSNATGGLTFSGATSADIATSSATTGNIFAAVATTINIGGTVASTTLNLLGSTATGVVNINSTKAASNYTSGALVVDGGVGIAGALYTNGLAEFMGGVTIRGGDLIADTTTFNLLNTTVTTLNILNTANSMFNVGSDNASTRTMNVYADMNIGSATTARTVNHYGQFNFGGAAGFTIVWNKTANSIDFIKL